LRLNLRTNLGQDNKIVKIVQPLLSGNPVKEGLVSGAKNLQTMSMFVYGIGWLSKEGYGCIRSGLQHTYESGEGAHTLPKRDIFSHPFKNFGRLDAISKMTVFGVSLALQDAGIEYSPIVKQDIGIVSTNAEGSLRSDIEYFSDYLAGGRTLSRGNLFIYTLPSSPLGEAAIHFGLLGPVAYVAKENDALTAVLDMAEEMILANESPTMLAGTAEADDAVFFVISRDQGGDRTVLCHLDEVKNIVETSPVLPVLMQKLFSMAVRKG
jgi:3-oxoacyl-[acyl-carrier-protein] synthase II